MNKLNKEYSELFAMNVGYVQNLIDSKVTDIIPILNITTKGNDNVNIIPLNEVMNQPDKQKAFKLLGQIVSSKIPNIQTVTLITEAWLKSYDKDNLSEFKADREKYSSISEMPNNVECIIVLLHSFDNQTGIGVLPISHDSDGNIIETEDKFKDTLEEPALSMSGLLHSFYQGYRLTQFVTESVN